MKDNIRAILLMKWDPLEIKDEPTAQDEYDSYIDALELHIKNGANPLQLANILQKIEINEMGLYPSEISFLLPIAHLLVGQLA